MRHNFTITSASKRDVSAIARIHVDTWRTTYNEIVPDDYLASLSYEKRESMWGQIIAENKEFTHLFVAKDSEGNVVGFSNGGKSRTTDLPYGGEIYAIYLRKEVQGKGVGKDLFLNSLEQLNRNGFTSMMLWVLEDNPTCKFYASMSGKPVSEKWEDIGGKRLKEVAYGWSDILATLRNLRPNFRHSCIKHYSEIQEADDAHYPGSDELLSIGSPFGRTFGFKRLGIHHEVLKPGRRTSWPHAEKSEEEFVYVIEGHPQAWIDGEVYDLKPGDAVGFVPGTGIAHTFINNTQTDVRMLVVGDTNRDDNKCVYPLHAKRNEEIKDFLWDDVPKRTLGQHSGLPEKTK